MTLKESASYSAFHHYITKQKPKPERCEHCKKIKRLALASKDPSWGKTNLKYTRNPEDYLWLCYSCHNKYDDVRVPPPKKTKQCERCNAEYLPNSFRQKICEKCRIVVCPLCGKKRISTLATSKIIRLQGQIYCSSCIQKVKNS